MGLREDAAAVDDADAAATLLSLQQPRIACGSLPSSPCSNHEALRERERRQNVRVRPTPYVDECKYE